MGISVYELIEGFRQASGSVIPTVVDPRRPGDIAACYAGVSLVERELSGHAELDIADADADANSWRWQSQNPDGYLSR